MNGKKVAAAKAGPVALVAAKAKELKRKIRDLDYQAACKQHEILLVHEKVARLETEKASLRMQQEVAMCQLADLDV